MDDESPSQRPGVVGALRDLSDSLTRLLQQQMTLLRLEVSREASETGSRSGQILLFAGIGLVGYFLLNVAIVCCTGYFAGFLGMAGAASILGAAHLAVALVQIRRHIRGFEEQQARLESKAEALAGAQEWETPQIEDNPSRETANRPNSPRE